jgi:hypothetical protein
MSATKDKYKMKQHIYRGDLSSSGKLENAYMEILRLRRTWLSEAEEEGTAGGAEIT